MKTEELAKALNEQGYACTTTLLFSYEVNKFKSFKVIFSNQMPTLAIIDLLRRANHFVKVVNKDDAVCYQIMPERANDIEFEKTTYDDLKPEDVEAMERLNEKNRWALSGKELEQMAAAHKAARLAGDEYECLLLEYRLDDMNFHTEARHLHAGEYGEALDAYADAFAPVQP